MQVVHDALHADDLPSGLVVTIGNYDGIHRGQRSVLELVRERAREIGCESAVITFDPHPLHVLRPERPVELLTTLAQKEKLLDLAGADHVLIVRFTPEFSRTPARSFVRGFLHERLDVKEIYVGSRFAFGHKRSGDLSLLRQMGESFGFRAFAVDEILEGDDPVSSTRIREAIRNGNVELAAELLGRPFSAVGIIARGEGMGRQLGFRTANLHSGNELLPKNGVYSCRVRFPSLDGTFAAVTNIGTRPTLYDEARRVVEGHILDFDHDVYGERAEFFFYDRIRDEKAFPNIMELKEQIGRDADTARRLLRERNELAVAPTAG